MLSLELIHNVDDLPKYPYFKNTMLSLEQKAKRYLSFRLKQYYNFKNTMLSLELHLIIL